MSDANTDRPWVDAARAAVAPFVAARVLVVASLALARYLVDELAVVGKYGRPAPGWFLWDGSFYLDIAERGYGAVGESGLRFFPLYPLAGRLLSFGLDARPSLLVIANVSAFAFTVVLFRLLVLETGDRAIARRAVWFASLFPFAAVLVLPYAEALFLLLAVLAFLGLRTRRWELAAVAGLLTGLARPLGLLLAVPAAVEVARRWRGSGRNERLRGLVAVAAPAAGTGIYLAWVHAAYGDAWLPVRAQQDPGLRGGFAFPVTRLADAFGDLLDDRIGSGLHGVWAVVFVGLLIVVARRLPFSYTSFSAAVLLVGLSASNLDSFERYAMTAFPLVVALAFVTERRDLERGLLAISAGGLVGYGLLAFLEVAAP